MKRFCTGKRGPGGQGREDETMEKLCERIAELLDQLGQSSQGTWQERKAALVSAINAQGGSGAAEVLGWFDADTAAID